MEERERIVKGIERKNDKGKVDGGTVRKERKEVRG